jgi:hypothetical protein
VVEHLNGVFHHVGFFLGTQLTRQPISGEGLTGKKLVLAFRPTFLPSHPDL